MASREMSKLYAAVHKMDEEERRRRAELLEKGREGDVGALCLLHEIYRLRLPQVEARLRVRMPWAGTPARPARRRAAA